MDNLYRNVGEKIRGLAKGIFIIEALFAVIGALILIAEDNALLGFIVLIAGPLVAWLSSLFLYAFGELVEKTSSNEKNTREILKNLQRNVSAYKMNNQKTEISHSVPDCETASHAMPTHTWRCAHCGKMVSQSPCEYCGK